MRDSLCDDVYSGDLLEALNDHSQRSTTEVLVGATREKVPDRRFPGGCTRLSGDSFLDTQIGLLYRRICVVFVFKRTNDRQRFGIATLFCKPNKLRSEDLLISACNVTYHLGDSGSY